MTINQRFKEIRIALNLTQKEYGEKLNIKPNTVAVIESGRRSVTQEAAVTLSITFDVNLDWLLYGKGDMFIPHSLDEELSGKFGEVLSDKHEGVPFSLLKKQCLLEILNFNDVQWENLVKIVAHIGANPELQRYVKNAPINSFDMSLLALQMQKVCGDGFIDAILENVCATDARTAYAFGWKKGITDDRINRIIADSMKLANATEEQTPDEES